MAYRGCRVLAVVPARGGSKSIPRKNLATLDGRSLISRAAEIAGTLPWVDVRIISSDDEEMIAEGRSAGLEALFVRPPELSADDSTSLDMWRHAWLKTESHYGCQFDVSILLEPTCPLRRTTDIDKTIEALFSGDHLAAATVSRIPAHFSPHKLFEVDKEGHLSSVWENPEEYSIRQKIPPYYSRNGVCYAAYRQAIVDKKTIVSKKCVAVIIDRPVINIDEPLDFAIAEILISKEMR